MVTNKFFLNVIFSQNHTEINSDDWTITKKTTRTIKHENFSKMTNLKVDRWALSLSVWYTATPGWTSKFGKGWKTRCQNAATRANIWRCFLVSWDDKYLWVMVSNNRHELYLCSKLLCFSSIHVFFWPNTVSKYQTWTNSYLIPSNA